MKIIVDQLWHQDKWIVIPTSLTYIKNDTGPGWQASFPRGPARQAVEFHHQRLSFIYGDWLSHYAERIREDRTFPTLFFVHSHRFLLMPIRYAAHQMPDLALIKRGLTQLADLDFPIALPLFGCQLGELPTRKMLLLLSETLPDHCTLCIRAFQIGVREGWGKTRYLKRYSTSYAQLEIQGGNEP